MAQQNKPQDKPVEPPTETPVEQVANQTPIQDAPAAKSDSTPDVSQDAPTEAPAETQQETPVETPAETPAEAQQETPVETPQEAPAEAQQETPVETPAETPADTPTETIPGPTAPNTNSAEAGDGAATNILDSAKEIAANTGQQILDWLTSPAFLVMVAVVILGYYFARLATKQLVKRVDFLRAEPTEGKALRVKKIVWQLRDLVFPAILIVIYAAASPALESIEFLGQNWLVKIAQGLAVVFLLYTAIKRFVQHPLVQKAVIWIAIPIAVLKVFGWFDEFQSFLQNDAKLELGSISIPAWTIANLLIFGSLLFWVGRISNSKGKAVIHGQDSIDAGTREVFAKIFEMVLFSILGVLLLNIAGIDLGALVVLGGAVGLGLGFGLQQIAANFISGMILLLDRTLKVGDYVVLPDGQEGFVEALNMRSATVETTDGKDIMVPNVKFIEEAYENWTHKDPRQRYEVYFSVAYNTDIDQLEDIVIPAISKHKSVLQDPEKPDLELREFGEFGIKFAIEFWCDGIDDGPNKFTSDLNFIVWRTLKEHGIQMPLPQREVRILKD